MHRCQWGGGGGSNNYTNRCWTEQFWNTEDISTSLWGKVYNTHPKIRYTNQGKLQQRKSVFIKCLLSTDAAWGLM